MKVRTSIKTDNPHFFQARCQIKSELIHLVKSTLTTGIAAVWLLGATSASALVITADYSALGTVYQNTSGTLSNTSSAGATDVTDIFKDNFQTAINYWENAVLLPDWSTTFRVELFSTPGAVGTNGILGHDANDRPNSNRLRVSLDGARFFVDPTPADDSEFNITDYSLALGGTTVNSGRYGSAVSGSAADNSGHWDLLSLFLHEIEHGLGFSRSTDRWDNVVNAAGDTLTVPTAVSGFSSDFDIPLLTTSSHIDGVTSSGDFNYTSIALPGWPDRTRALLSGVDILAVCAIEGCTPEQMNLDPSPHAATVPEPGTLMLLVAGLALVGGMYRRRPTLRSV